MLSISSSKKPRCLRFYCCPIDHAFTSLTKSRHHVLISASLPSIPSPLGHRPYPSVQSTTPDPRLCAKHHFPLHLPVIRLRDCNVALALLRSTPYFGTIRIWSLKDEDTVRTLIVQRWTEGSCTIALMANRPNLKDVFQTSPAASSVDAAI